MSPGLTYTQDVTILSVRLEAGAVGYTFTVRLFHSLLQAGLSRRFLCPRMPCIFADGALGAPHRGVKGQMYEGGDLVPGLIEWPARISRPGVSPFRASTSDLLPTLCAITGQPLPNRPLDGIVLTDAFDGKMSQRSVPLFFWEYATSRFAGATPQPYISPELQQGTTPLAKLMGGKSTRDFINWRHPTVDGVDYLGSRAIIDGRFKLVIHKQENENVRRELFEVDIDPAEKTNLIDQQRTLADQLQSRLRDWQRSVLTSLTGADY